MAITNRQVIINLHTLTNTGTPDASLFEVGEIAVQNTASDPALYIHSGTTAVAKIISEAKVQELIANAGVQSIAGETGAFTLRGNGANDGDVNLTLGANNEIQADFVGLNNITAATVNAVKGTATTYTDLGLVEAKLGDLDTKNGTQDAAISANTDDISALDTRLDSLDANSVTAATQNGTPLTITNNTLAFSADTNVIETVKVNGTALTVTDKAVDVTVPTKVSDLDNDSNFATTGDVDTAKTQLIGDMTGDTKTLGALQDAIEALDTNAYTGVTEGNGIDVTDQTNGHMVAVKLSNDDNNDLTFDANGGLLLDGTAYATAEQGAKADTAIQKVTINGTDYTGTTVNLGTNYVQDSAYTHTDNNYTTDEKTKLAGISTGATKVTDGATNGYINIDGTETEVYAHPTFASAETAAVKVGRDAEGHTTLGDALALDDMSDVVLASPADKQVLTYDANASKWKNMVLPAAAEYTLTGVTPSNTAYTTAYQLLKDGVAVGDTINIPKDQFLKEAKFYKDAAAAQADGKTVPSGTVFPTLYFEWELTNGVITPSWVPVSDLVDTYSAGTGVTLDGTTFKGVVDSANAHGLSVGADGFALALADGTNAGAMSSAHYTKLEGIETGAEVNTIEGVQLNGADIALDANKKANVVLPSATVSGENAGVNVQVVETTGEIKTVTVTVTPGSVADNDTSLVNGDAVYDAIEAAKTAIKGDATDSGDTLEKLEDRIEDLEGAQHYTGVTAGNNGITVTATTNGHAVYAKVNEANGLSITNDGISMALATDSVPGAMSAADHTQFTADSAKLANIEASAQVNTLEGVQVNGTDLTPDGNKKVNVTVAEGATDGTIAVNGNDVAVHGLGSAAYEDTTAFDASGAAATAKAEVIGESGDDASADTIYGAKAYADSVVADGLTGISAADSSVTVSAKSNKAQTVKVNVSEDADNALTLVSDGLKVDKDLFDEAGAAASAKTEVIGQSGDDASANTIYGAKAYADEAVAAKNVSATGDTYVSATAANNTVTVAATQKTQDVIDNALVGIESGKESGASVNSSNELDFSLFRIDAGTY